MTNTTTIKETGKEINLYPNENPKNTAEAKKDEKNHDYKSIPKKIKKFKDHSMTHLIGFVNSITVQKLIRMI